MTGGDFTQDAYQQLKDAYADSLSTQDEQEQEGREVLGQRMSLETMPVDSPWRDKIKDWQYPNGKSEYLDGKQSPEEILEIMRASVTEKMAEKEAEDEMTDDELDILLDEILNATDDEDESDEDEEESEEEEDEEPVAERGEIEEDDEVDLSGLTEDEVNAFLAENPDYELVTEDKEEEEEVEEEYDEEEEEVDPEEVAVQIAELKEQIEAFRFSNISDEDVEE